MALRQIYQTRNNSLEWYQTHNFKVGDRAIYRFDTSVWFADFIPESQKLSNLKSGNVIVKIVVASVAIPKQKGCMSFHGKLVSCKHLC